MKPRKLLLLAAGMYAAMGLNAQNTYQHTFVHPTQAYDGNNNVSEFEASDPSQRMLLAGWSNQSPLWQTTQVLYNIPAGTNCGCLTNSALPGQVGYYERNGVGGTVQYYYYSNVKGVGANPPATVTGYSFSPSLYLNLTAQASLAQYQTLISSSPDYDMIQGIYDLSPPLPTGFRISSPDFDQIWASGYNVFPGAISVTQDIVINGSSSTPYLGGSVHTNIKLAATTSDNSGIARWNHIIRIDNTDDEFSQVLLSATPDRAYAVAGIRGGHITALDQITAANPVIAWSRRLNIDGFTPQIYHITEDPQGNLHCVGQFNPGPLRDEIAFYAKIGPNGTVLTTRTFEIRGGRVYFESIAYNPTTQDKFIAGHVIYTTSSNTTHEELLILNLNSQNNLVWYNTYGTPDRDVPTMIKQLPDSRLIVAFYMQNASNGFHPAALLLNSRGSRERSMEYLADQHISRNVFPIQDGFMLQFNARGENIMIARTDMQLRSVKCFDRELNMAIGRPILGIETPVSVRMDATGAVLEPVTSNVTGVSNVYRNRECPECYCDE